MKMVKLKPLCILIGALSLAAVQTLAGQNDEEQALTAREFLAGCEQAPGASRPTQACMQYVFGLVQTVVMLQEMEPGTSLFCIDPQVISLEEVTDRVTAWLSKVPDRLDEEAYVLVSEALNASYPCTAKDTI